jgi:hypothetical protein
MPAVPVSSVRRSGPRNSPKTLVTAVWVCRVSKECLRRGADAATIDAGRCHTGPHPAPSGHAGDPPYKARGRWFDARCAATTALSLSTSSPVAGRGFCAAAPRHVGRCAVPASSPGVLPSFPCQESFLSLAFL